MRRIFERQRAGLVAKLGLTEDEAEALRAAGYTSPRLARAAGVAELQRMAGIGEATARRIRGEG